jgi:hypothetical protein
MLSTPCRGRASFTVITRSFFFTFGKTAGARSYVPHPHPVPMIRLSCTSSPPICLHGLVLNTGMKSLKVVWKLKSKFLADFVAFPFPKVVITPSLPWGISCQCPLLGMFDSSRTRTRPVPEGCLVIVPRDTERCCL